MVPANPPAPFTNNVGGDGDQPDATALQGNQGHKTGMYALENAPGFNILCLPDVMNLSDTAASAVITQAAGYCQTKYAFHVVDVPQNPNGGAASQALRESVTGIQTWMAANATLRSSYAALYYPRPQIPDPLNGFRLRPVASSGTLAGLYAQTDGTRGVWKAPAGTAAVLKNVPALGYVLNDPENGVLNQVGINCLRSLPVYGNICWGSRTLDGADQLESQWKYIPVRRLANYIEASLYQGIQWVVFEPNDEPLWSQIRLNVGTFMQQLFEKGAFQGTTPKSAYFVKCDSESTSQADIDQGVVNIIVGFAPLLPAEFVILQIQQIAGQSPT
nr:MULTISPECIES: phage tail sheath C-terminal domain-containing protein [unclassified Mycolicibacterium]